MATKVWAHRGASAYAPENTIPAFRLAMEQGADGIELDVQLSKDEQVIVFHDAELKRMTGVCKKVEQCTWNEMSAFRLCKTEEKFRCLKRCWLKLMGEYLSLWS